jgi:hypothetical protein
MIELGAGHGRFSYLLLDALCQLEEFWPRRSSNSPYGAVPLFTYILTDFTDENITFWSAHPSFTRFRQRGLVSFGVFDAEDPFASGGIRLFDGSFLQVGSSSHKNGNTNPIGVVANYVFDTLRHDAFRLVPVSSEAATSASEPAALQLHELLLTVSTSQPYEPDRTDPELLKRFRGTWTQREVPGGRVPIVERDEDGEEDEDAETERFFSTSSQSPADAPSFSYYSGRDAPFNSVLSTLCQSFASSPLAREGFSFLLPTGALRCLQWLQEFSQDNLVLLCGDKAHTSPSEMRGFQREPHLAVHGSFSMMVNFLAMEAFFLQASSSNNLSSSGFRAVYTPYLDGFKNALFVRMGGENENAPRIEQKDGEEFKQPQISMKSGQLQENGSVAVKLENDQPIHPRTPVSPNKVPSRVGSPALPMQASPVTQNVSPSFIRTFSSFLPHTSLAFHSISTFTPDSFSTLQRCIKDESPNPSLKQIVSLLRLSNFDAELFWKFRSGMIEKIGSWNAMNGAAGNGTGTNPNTTAANANPSLFSNHHGISSKLLSDLRSDLGRLEKGWFPLMIHGINAQHQPQQQQKDFLFELGRLAMGLHSYNHAKKLFLSSIESCGKHHVTYYNLGLCEYYSISFESALLYFNLALELYPDYSEAKEWRARMKLKIQTQQELERQTQVQQQHQRQLVQIKQEQKSSPIKSTIQSHSEYSLSNHSNGINNGGGGGMPFPSTAGSSLPFPSTTAVRAAAAAAAGGGGGRENGGGHQVLNTFVQTYQGFN